VGRIFLRSSVDGHQAWPACCRMGCDGGGATAQ
jgi:hypothetical protein